MWIRHNLTPEEFVEEKLDLDWIVEEIDRKVRQDGYAVYEDDFKEYIIDIFAEGWLGQYALDKVAEIFGIEYEGEYDEIYLELIEEVKEFSYDVNTIVNDKLEYMVKGELSFCWFEGEFVVVYTRRLEGGVDLRFTEFSVEGVEDKDKFLRELGELCYKHGEDYHFEWREEA